MLDIKQIEVKVVISFLKSLLPSEEKEINKETNLIEEFGLDEIDIIEIMMEFEVKLKISICDDDIHSILGKKVTPRIITKLINKIYIN